MHCEQPTCAEVCPADAIKRTDDGVVQTRAQAALHRLQQLRARLPVRRARRCDVDRELMMKCDMCYDRTSVGKKPMCATVCPSQALFFGTREEIGAAAAVDADEPVPVRRADDHDAREHDGAARRRAAAAGRRHRGDGRAAARRDRAPRRDLRRRAAIRSRTWRCDMADDPQSRTSRRSRSTRASTRRRARG